MVRRPLRSLLIGLVLLPISVVPFLGYARWTPEGRFLTDRISARIDPPELPVLDDAQRAQARAAAPRYDGPVMPLVYHGLGSSTEGEGGRFSISPERFAEQLAWLRAAGMQFVTAREVVDAFAGRSRLPERAVMITFDDGRSDALLWATPLLEQAGAVATMFVIADKAEHPTTYYSGWDAMERSGVWDIESHTADLHHEVEVDGRRLPALTALRPGESIDGWRKRIDEDLDRADAEIERETGRAPVAFAYPFGAWGGDDRTNGPAGIATALHELLAEHYAIALHQDGQDEMELADALSPPAGIRRLEVGDWSGASLLRRISDATLRTFLARVGGQ
jgi:peptidoglycan/xylan/chitin deacetylase (PgdA/CDA1 family)